VIAGKENIIVKPIRRAQNPKTKSNKKTGTWEVHYVP